VRRSDAKWRYERLKAHRILATAFFLLIPPVVQAGPFIDVESGVAFNGYNDVRIPGDTGSDISLTDDLNAEPSWFWRLRLGLDLGQKHRLSLLVAPLRLEASGSVNRAIDFNGVTFGAGDTLSSRYRFDSYRVTYSYRLLRSRSLDFHLGITAKIRDASIRIESADTSSENSNTGFVPLINFALNWSWSSRFGLLFEGDALAAPQGRAEDLLVAAYGTLSDKLRLRLGYRLLEGGADNDDVYAFALVHYLAGGLTWSL
jgi:hypothetical protein